MSQNGRDARFGAFLSYAQQDDDYEDGRITELRRRLEAEVHMQMGVPFKIFHDRRDIFYGQQWRARIGESLDGSTLLITIITPSFLKSKLCREEVLVFLEGEQSLDRNDLIIPILYMRTPGLDNPHDEVAVELAKRQYFRWGDLRFEDMNSNSVRKAIAKLAEDIVSAFKAVLTSEAEAPLDNLSADDISDDPPGLMELLAEAEEAIPLFNTAIRALTDLLHETAEVTTMATSELQAKSTVPNPGAARVLVIRRLAKRLEKPISEMENVTDDYVDQLARVGSGINVLTELIRDAKTEDNIEAAHGLLKNLVELAKNGETGIDQIARLREILANNYRLSSTLRPVLRRMSNALHKVEPSKYEFITWRDDLSAVLLSGGSNSDTSCK
ncbi:MAG: toll/interleukin-1 receptor domain-containing protein [bacterium]|nr:toll/interleukin-1 receptor domain-containing protein [bacterium]MDE0351661.1 toll/interleukin-1 receptor domain-containing protein [bacterium]